MEGEERKGGGREGMDLKRSGHLGQATRWNGRLKWIQVEHLTPQVQLKLKIGGKGGGWEIGRPEGGKEGRGGVVGKVRRFSKEK